MAPTAVFCANPKKGGQSCWSTWHFWIWSDVGAVSSSLCCLHTLTPYLLTCFWCHSSAQNLPSAVSSTLPETRLLISHSVDSACWFTLQHQEHQKDFQANSWQLLCASVVPVSFCRSDKLHTVLQGSFCSLPRLRASRLLCLCSCFQLVHRVLADVAFRGNGFVFTYKVTTILFHFHTGRPFDSSASVCALNRTQTVLVIVYVDARCKMWKREVNFHVCDWVL